MKFSPGFLMSALCWRRAYATGHIYIHNPDQSQSPRPSSTLSPAAARLVLAQRAGVEDFHRENLHFTDEKVEEVIGAINDYGLRKPIFSNAGQGTKSVLLFVEHDDGQEYLDSEFPDHFAISNDPSSESAWELWHDLEAQSLSIGRRNEYVAITDKTKLKSHIDNLKQGINTAITVLHLPPTPKVYGASAEWGTYSMPDRTSILHHKRQDPQEEPLEQAPDLAFQAVSSSTSRPTPLQSSPLPGILPACFPSLSSCNALTRNCTGHGACGLKYTDRSADPAKACYACACAASTKETDGKVQTTFWGGPACQKRDVSVQFWLIALFSVALVGLVSFAVGQVWSMGDEELPSVIGAGVSGPSARR